MSGSDSNILSRTAAGSLLTLCLLLSTALPLWAQTRVIQGPPHFRAFQSYESDGRFTRAVLRNGMTLLIEEHHIYPVAAVTALVDNSGLDPLELAAAEMLGHLWERRLAQSQAAYERGAKTSFSSNADRNLYALTVSGRSLPRALEAHAQFWTAPESDAALLSQALGRMRESARLHAGQPLRQAQARLAGMGVVSKGLRQWGVAEVEKLSSDGAQAVLKRVFDKTMKPERVILVISGAVFAENVLKTLVEQHAPRRGSGKPVRLDSVPSIAQVASAPGLSFRQVRQGTGRYLIVAGLPTVGWAHSDHLKIELLKAALGLGRASLLGRYLVEPGQAYTASVSRRSLARRGLLSAVAVPDPQQIDAAEAALLTQLEILRSNPLSPLLLERAKAQVVRGYYQRLQSLRGRAEALAEAEWTGDYKSRDTLTGRVAKITAKDLQQAARRHLQTSRLALLEDFPQTAEERSFDSDSFAQTMKVLVEGAAAKQTAAMNVAKEAADAEGLGVDFEFKAEYKRSDMRRTSVLRGPEIFFQEQHDLPLLDLGLFFAGGRVDESADTAGVTELLLHAMLRGGEEDTPQLPLERLEAMGADIEIVNETDFFGFRATLLSPYRGEFFGTLLQWLRSVELSPEKLEVEKKRLLAKLREDEGALGSDLDWVRRQLFQDQTYGQSRYGSEASLASLGMEQLAAWKESKVDKRHPWIIMRGAFDGTTFLRPFISRLSNSRLEGVAVGRPKVDEYGYETQPARPQGAGEEMAAVAREGQIVIGYAGPSKGTREEWMADVLENLLEGLGGRLEVLLQEDEKSGVPVRILHEAGLRKGALFALAESDPQKAEAVQEAIISKLAALRDVVIRPLTWNYALDSTITDFYIRQQQGSDYTLELARNILAGQTTRFEQAYINTVRQAKPSDLQALAMIYFPLPEQESEDSPGEGQ